MVKIITISFVRNDKVTYENIRKNDDYTTGFY